MYCSGLPSHQLMQQNIQTKCYEKAIRFVISPAFSTISTQLHTPQTSPSWANLLTEPVWQALHEAVEAHRVVRRQGSNIFPDISSQLSALRGSHPWLPGKFQVLIALRAWVNPRAIMRLEGLGQLKIQAYFNHMSSPSQQPLTISHVSVLNYDSLPSFPEQNLNFSGCMNANLGMVRRGEFVLMLTNHDIIGWSRDGCKDPLFFVDLHICFISQTLRLPFTRRKLFMNVHIGWATWLVRTSWRQR
jgi:hypothetical protein